MEKRPARVPLYVGLVLIACGWVVLYLGWQQAAEQELETGQLPYLLSGGFGALGLWVLGVGGVLVDAVQQSRWSAARSAESIKASIDALPQALKPEPEPETDEETPRRPRRSSRSGTRRPSR